METRGKKRGEKGDWKMMEKRQEGELKGRGGGGPVVRRKREENRKERRKEKEEEDRR